MESCLQKQVAFPVYREGKDEMAMEKVRIGLVMTGSIITLFGMIRRLILLRYLEDIKMLLLILIIKVVNLTG